MIFDKQIPSSFRRIANILVNYIYKDSLIRNSIYIMSTTFVTAGTGYFYWIVAAHLYSVHDVGLASAFISALTFAAFLSTMGIGETLVQTLPHCEAGDKWSLTFNAGITVGTLSSLLIGSIIVLVLSHLSSELAVFSHQYAYAIAFVVGVTLWTLSTLFDRMFVAERSAGFMLVRNAIFGLLKIPLLLLPLLFIHIGAFGIFASWILATGISLIGAALLIPRLGRFYSLIRQGLIRHVCSMLTLLAGHHLINLSETLAVYLLPLFVTARLTATANAYFYTDWMICSVFFMLSPAVGSSLFAEGSHKRDGILRKARNSVLIVSGLLAPAILIVLLGGRFILAIFGPSYAQHGLLLLLILVASAIPDAIISIYVTVLRVQKHLFGAAVLCLSLAIFCLFLAWMLLPIMGVVGAGLAWLIARLVGSLVVGVHIIISRVSAHITD